MASDPPSATYRLQLGPDLDFAAAGDLVGYLADLGVSHLYLSPVLEARPGSAHGYDVVDPTTVSAALGGEDGLRTLAGLAGAGGLGLVVDIVPNHLGVGPDNPLWEALLAEGRYGRAGRLFDVDWSPPLPDAVGKVILPILGEPYGRVLRAGEITVEDGRDGRPRVRYHDHSFPVSAESCDALRRAGGPQALAGVPGRAATWGRLHGLLETQHYRLVHWRSGDALVNYRRFFAIDDLAAVRVEDDAVFDHTHGKIVELAVDGVVDGLRVDHVDGLTDPAGYLRRLRDRVGQRWVVVEKILGPGEQLPDWPVAGTTGYDFLGDCLRLFVDPGAEPRLTATALAFDAWPDDYDELVRACKSEVVDADLAADCERVVQRLWEACQAHLEIRDVSRQACRAVVVGTLACLDVYRGYVRPGGEPSADEAARVEAAVGAAGAIQPRAAPDFLWEFFSELLRGRADGPVHAEVVRRFQQLASAAMAKGVEDTLLYRQHRLAALNEVGVEPEHPAVDPGAFHEANRVRARRHPTGMLATATHDTKRGEDTRLRIAALSELSEDWEAAVVGWRARNRDAVRASARGPAPDAATEYLLYQTLVGVWPLADVSDHLPSVGERLRAYAVKACREAGLRTSWTDPDPGFEEGVEGFVDGVLGDPRFIADMDGLAGRAAEIAIVSGLAQTVLRCTSPGVPDTYRGAELWDDNLVDPDNRRAVDFALRRRLLADLDAGPVDLRGLVAARRDGRVKLWVLSRALRTRRALPACFGADGGYEPMGVSGRWAEHVVAFARVAPDGAAAVTVAPRLPGAVMAGRGRPPLAEDWADTAVVVPAGLAGRGWQDRLGGPGAPAGGALRLADVLRDLPVSLLTAPSP